MSTLNVNNINEVGGVDAVISSGILDKGSLPTGSILQIVSGSSTTDTTIATTSYTDTTLQATITPTSASSKVLVLVSQQLLLSRQTNNAIKGDFQIVRGATSVATFARALIINAGTAGSGFLQNGSNVSLAYLDSPNTTSATTYKTQARVSTTSNSGQMRAQNENGRSTMLLLEVAA